MFRGYWTVLSERGKLLTVESSGINEKVLSALQELGLTPNEALLFKFLLEKGGTNTLDMNKYLKIRQPQLYDLLTSLERKGMINVIEGRPKIYEALKLDVILRNKKENLQENESVLVRWEEQSAGKEEPIPAIWVSRTWKSFRNNTLSLIDEAEKSLMIQTPLNFLPELMAELDTIELRNQRIFLLIYGNGIEEEDLNSILEKEYFSDIGLLGLGQFFAIVEDEGSSCFMPRNIIEKDKSQRYGYIFRDRNMTWFIIHNFFTGWSEANIVKRKQAEVGMVYTNQRFAVYDLSYLLKDEKREVWVSVTGFDKKKGKDTVIDGYVESVVTTNEVYNFNLVTKSGERFSVGGYDSKGERIEAEKIQIVQIS